VTDIGTYVAGPRQPDKRIEISAVEINLAAMRVCDCAQFNDRFFEHAMSRGVCNHAGGEPACILFGLGAEIRHVDVAAYIGSDDNNGHAAHMCRSRIGAVCRGRDEAHIAA
jgi:hypothetical protein